MRDYSYWQVGTISPLGKSQVLASNHPLSETTTSTLKYCVYEMVQNPSALEALRKDV